MKITGNFQATSVFFTTFSILFAACGGGGGGDAVPLTAVSGTILDTNGVPVAGATVTIASTPVTAVTDSQGRFEAQVEAGNHILTAFLNDVLFLQMAISVTDGVPVDLGSSRPTISGGFFRWFFDGDGDGYGAASYSVYGTSNPSVGGTTFTQLSSDCNDSQPAIHPGAAEICSDGTDQDCDGFSRCILLVDDDQGVNNRCPLPNINADVEQVYAQDLAAIGLSYDLVRVQCGETNGPSLADISLYALVVWVTGADAENTLTDGDRTTLMDYLDGGGRLFLSSQEVLYDLGNGQDGAVADPFMKDYLGVVYVWNDSASTNTVLGKSGTPTEGLTLSGCDSDHNGQVDGFPSPGFIQETGLSVWDTSAGAPGSLLFTATSTGFAQTVFVGIPCPIASLSDGALTFSSHSMFCATDGQVTPWPASWYEWSEDFGANHFFRLQLTQTTYTFKEITGAAYCPYPDILNPIGNTPSYAHTFLEVPDPYLPEGFGNFGLIALTATNAAWRTIFLAYPYEGIAEETSRRELLARGVTWLLSVDQP